MVSLNSDSCALAGLWVPLITPLTSDDELDVRALGGLATRVLNDGARGIVALGTTGEPATLTKTERMAVVDTCRQVCADTNKDLMVGVGTNDTRTTIEACIEMGALAGVSSVLVVVPYYTLPDVRGIVEHFRAVAAQSPVPVVLYNVPHRSGRGLGSAEILEIASFPNVIGLKQATGALDMATLQVLSSKPASFAVLAGDDAFIVPTILMGGLGAIAASANVCTDRFSNMIERALFGDFDTARALAQQLLPVTCAGFAEPNPSVWKGVLHALGELGSANMRLPMMAASKISVQNLLEVIRTLAESAQVPEEMPASKCQPTALGCP